MLGNEAIARGILEAGVIVVAGYPGTPSSEILDTLGKMQPYHSHLKIEWSINEKVCFETAYGAAISNIRAVACMKHVGVNVASDALLTASYAGTRGGMVLISADDPSLFSSQNEQDNRYYGLHRLIPVFEPSTPQEAKDIIKFALDFSEMYECIVIFRTTTRLNHGRGDVVLDEIRVSDRQADFDWDRKRWVCLPSHSRIHRLNQLKRFNLIQDAADDNPYNSLRMSEQEINGIRYGFISTGVPYAHTIDTLNYYGVKDKVSILKLGMVNPVPLKLIQQFLTSVDKVLVVEELEPILENSLKKIAYDMKLTDVEIYGKDIFPQNFEFPAELYLEKFAEFLDLEYNKERLPELELKLPPRLPVLCPGCSHRSTFYAIKQAEKEMKKKFINLSDIGCYTLAVYKPLEGIDTQICMGGSIGLANGITKVYDKDTPILAIIGDSTFFHSGVTSLINAVYNQNNMIVVILDNRSTSMTGFQDNPGTGVKITKEPGNRIIIEDLVKGCGVPEDHIWVVDSNDISKVKETVLKAIKVEGVRVIISRHICSLLELSKVKKYREELFRIQVDPETCTGCLQCINQFGCPAISLNQESKKAQIDETLCRACEVSMEVCPHEAIIKKI